MTLVFHDGKNSELSGYCNLAWNDPSVIGNIGALGSYNTEARINKLVDDYDPKLDGISLKTLKDNQGDGYVTAYLVKGVHQVDNNHIIATPHISVGMSGYIYHVQFLADSKGIKGVSSITRGDRYKDPDGFQTAKKK